MDYEEIMDEEEEIKTLYQIKEPQIKKAISEMVEKIQEYPEKKKHIMSSFNMGKAMVSLDNFLLMLDVPGLSVVIKHSIGDKVYHFTPDDFSNFAALLYVRLHDAGIIDSHIVYRTNASILMVKYEKR